MINIFRKRISQDKIDEYFQRLEQQAEVSKKNTIISINRLKETVKDVERVRLKVNT